MLLFVSGLVGFRLRQISGLDSKQRLTHGNVKPYRFEAPLSDIDDVYLPRHRV